MEKSKFVIFINLLILFNIVSSQKNNRLLSIINFNNAQKNQICQIKSYQSKFTGCQIKFKRCTSNKFQFQSCNQRQCSRFIRGIDCKLQIKIQLSQNQCYKKCCGSEVFSSLTCDKYNQFKQQKDQFWLGPFTLILLIFSLVIIIFILLIIIKIQKDIKQKPEIFPQRQIINWKTDKKMEVKCDICYSIGAILTTPCQHHFHIYCFEQNWNNNKKSECPKCNTVIVKNIKISCRNCKNKSFKIKLQAIQQLSSIIQQAQTFHTDYCTESIQSQEQFITDGNS